MKLESKVAIVTGGARDLGRAISVKLAMEGAKVVVNYFDNEADAVETAGMISAVGGECITVQGDMTKAEDVKVLVEKSREAFGDVIDV
ncbi:MAG: SDR family NAD(P)-dependent oxidoreductase, partial [Rikenellaceae bacterium]